MLAIDERKQDQGPVEHGSKPPPLGEPKSGDRLFEILDELRARHGSAMDWRQRIVYAASALIGGWILFVAVHWVILLLG